MASSKREIPHPAGAGFGMTVSLHFSREGEKRAGGARSLLPFPVTTQNHVIPRTPLGGRGISRFQKTYLFSYRFK